jgi:hypothetical protein
MTPRPTSQMAPRAIQVPSCRPSALRRLAQLCFPDPRYAPRSRMAATAWQPALGSSRSPRTANRQTHGVDAARSARGIGNDASGSRGDGFPAPRAWPDRAPPALPRALRPADPSRRLGLRVVGCRRHALAMWCVAGMCADGAPDQPAAAGDAVAECSETARRFDRAGSLPQLLSGASTWSAPMLTGRPVAAVQRRSPENGSRHRRPISGFARPNAIHRSPDR